MPDLIAVGDRPPQTVVLVAHGSRDPRAAATTRALARAVAAARPGLDVRVAFLELAEPSPAQVLSRVDGPAIVVPLLLTRAYHGSVDLPEQVSGYDCVITDTLGGPSEELLRALAKRLCETAVQFDAVVLSAAGTRVAEARLSIADVAVALGERLGVPTRVAYAAGTTPTGDTVVRALRAETGNGRVAVASYFLAPGRLYDVVTAACLGEGAIEAAKPLGASWELARLILARVDAAALVAA